MYEAAQIEIGVVGDVGRHLRIAEIGPARAMRFGSERANEMSFSSARLTVKKQYAVLHMEAAAGGDRCYEVVEFATRCGMHFRHVDGIGAPQVVFPRNRMLKRLAQLVWRE